MTLAPESDRDVRPGRLKPEAYAKAFCDINPPLTALNAKVESSRCYYCYDAPCIQACPTEIDIPSFIRKIGNGNVRGAAMDILKQNILGGTCSRVCPVETLCQEACVRNTAEDKPVQIGLLQRYATDELFKSGEQPFKRAPSTGKSVAVIGAGPAGLSCAHELAMNGYEVTIFEAREKSGGLNEYGIAPYKMVDDFAQREVNFLMGIGGITVQHGKSLGGDLDLFELKNRFASVFLGVGLGGNNTLGVSGEELDGVIDATQYIARIRQEKDLSKIPLGRHVIVVGGGNTAIDMAVQAKRLGAEFVTLVYRRGTEQMGATWHEQEIAQTNGVLIKTWAQPHRIVGSNGSVTSMEFEYTVLASDGRLKGTGQYFTLQADQVFKAIGQKLATDKLPPQLEVANGKFVVNDRFETTVPGVYSGGDCVAGGEDLTVNAVRQGKLAAQAIHRALQGQAQVTGVTRG